MPLMATGLWPTMAHSAELKKLPALSLGSATARFAVLLNRPACVAGLLGIPRYVNSRLLSLKLCIYPKNRGSGTGPLVWKKGLPRLIA